VFWVKTSRMAMAIREVFTQNTHAKR